MFDDFIYPPPLEPYKYRNKRMMYRTEELFFSKEELKEAKSAKSTPVTPAPLPPPERPVKCIIDTDIGTDFDDTMALLYALHLDELEVLGLTTNYGPSNVRAAVAHVVQDTYHKCHPDKPVFPIIAGASRQIGTHRDVFLAGNEGKPFFSNEELSTLIVPEDWNNFCQTDAADFMALTVKQYPNEVIIISLGIPTNIALAIRRFGKDFVSKVKEIVVMGCGSFVTGDTTFQKSPFPLPANDVIGFLAEGRPIHVNPNHNLSGDTMASKIIFSSGIKLKIIPHDVTRKFFVRGDPIEFLRSRAALVTDYKNPTDPAGVVGLIMLEWFKRRHGQNGQCPHDPLTVHEAVYGDDDSPLLYVPGTMYILEWAAFGYFVPNINGPHRLAVTTHNEEQFLDRLGKSLMIDDCLPQNS